MAWLVALVVVALAARRFAGGYPPVAYRHLDRRSAGACAAACDVLFPGGGAVPPSAVDAGVLDYVDRYLGWQSPGMRRLILLMIALFEHGTLLFGPHLRRMSRLDPAARVRYLDGWERSPLYLRRMAFQSFRSVLCIAYLNDPAVQQAMGIRRAPACAARAVAP